eukprot:COSAG01_NODE_1383_length_10520_cov_83.640342_6_plen_242_part_00
MSLANIKKKARQKAPRLVLFGGSGVGKTSFAASMNRPIFLLCEDGLGKIEVDHFPLALSFEDVLKNLQSLIDNDNDYKTLVVDSLDWLEPLIWDKACQDNNWKSIEQPFGKGFTEALKYWREYVSLLNELREKGFTIMQIAHNQIKRFESPEIEAYDRHELKLHRKAAALILEHSDCCFFANYKLGTVQVKDKKGQLSSKAVQGERQIYTEERPAYLAKNRYDLPPVLPFDWKIVRGEMLK